MAISPGQKRAIEEVIQTLCAATKGRRKICEIFMELPDKEAWPQYYKVIPEPRCLDGIKTGVEKGKYKDAIVVYEDLILVFANALHYNEIDSQIAKDAVTLKALLEETWEKTPGLPPPPTSPPVTEPAKSPAAPTQPPPPPPPPPRVITVSHIPRTSTSILAPPVVALPKATSLRQSVPYAPQTQQAVEDDGDMSPEPQEHETESHSWESAARDEESAEIVRQLERGLPRWDGGHERGWMEDFPENAASKYADILGLLKGYKTTTGQYPWSSLEEIPEDAQVKDRSFTDPISFKIIETRARTHYYLTAEQFDWDLARLFERARRWHTAGTEAYGHCVLLQRLYHLLTSPPFPNTVPATTSNFSSIAAGPGVARPLHSSSESAHAVTTFRIPTKDRIFTEELTYKGMTIRVGDWVHLMNPDDPAKPIIAQVFKIWVPDGDSNKRGQPCMTACWYFRPEQTFHPAYRQFWEGEVFKTGHFADHVAEDIIEQIACQFTAKHIRGRPRPPYWYPSWPLYVCDSRYNDRERVFVKIKNWNSCIPEDYRKNDFMPIYPFERIIYPKRYPSPFLSGITGPGGIGDSIERAEGEKIEGGGTGRRRARKNVSGQQTTDHAGPRYGTYVGAPSVGAPSAGAPSGRAGSSGASQAAHQPHPPVHLQQKRVEDRSIGTAAGGLANLQNNAIVEVLPAETVKHFDRDPETNQVLWFSGPPIDMARTPAPQYSLKYLHFVAMKRKQQKVEDREEEGNEESNRLDINEDATRPEKRRRIQGKSRMTDVLDELWARVSSG